MGIDTDCVLYLGPSEADETSVNANVIKRYSQKGGADIPGIHINDNPCYEMEN